MADRSGFSIYRMRPASRRGLVVAAGLAVSLLTLVLPARADGPEWGTDPFVFMTVTPDDRLGDGQMVTVQAGPFPLFADVVVRECAPTALGPQCDQAALASVNVGSSGNLGPLTVTVKRIINTGTTTFNCGVQACALVAFPNRGSWTQHHISFGSAGTSVPTTTDTTAPTTTSATTVPNSSTTTIGTTIPGPTTTTLLPPAGGLLCDLFRALRDALGGFLAGLFDGLLNLFGCPPAG